LLQDTADVTIISLGVIVFAHEFSGVLPILMYLYVRLRKCFGGSW